MNELVQFGIHDREFDGLIGLFEHANCRDDVWGGELVGERGGLLVFGIDRKTERFGFFSEPAHERATRTPHDDHVRVRFGRGGSSRQPESKDCDGRR
jgi:hypothetical protein